MSFRKCIVPDLCTLCTASLNRQRSRGKNKYNTNYSFLQSIRFISYGYRCVFISLHIWSDFILKWSGVTLTFLGTEVQRTLGWPYIEGTWLYCDYCIWCVSCAVVILTCFVICDCVCVCGCFESFVGVLVICVLISFLCIVFYPCNI